MCDTEMLTRWAKDAKAGGLSRRQFGVLGAAGLAAGCTTMGGAVGSLTESRVSVATAAGTMDGFFVHPASGEYPGVIFWPDIASLREAKMQMARRLAGEGYAVFVANPYYRDVPAPQFADFADFAASGGFQKVTPWREKLTAQAIGSDAAAIAAWLDAQDAVDTDKGIGTQGYCMGGPFTVWSAAAVPGRIRAAASFHGGGLVRDGDNSPHRMLERSRASYLIAVAQNDDEKAPDHKTIFGAAGDAAGRPAEIEVYAADHGWTVPDSPVYDQAEAERAYARLLALYERAL